MIDNDQTEEEYQAERLSTVTADGLRFVPEGDVPKVYSIVCANASDWNEMHNYIINDNEIDGIPNRKIDCTDLCKTCDKTASYEMSDAEAEQLKNHPKIIGVELDPDYYAGTFKGAKDRVTSFTNRYASNVKVARDMGADFIYSTGSDFLSRTGSSIYRHQQKVCPWDGISDGTILNANPKYLGDGTDVDVVVGDESGWYGHVEFVKTGVGEPSNYVGGNVLKSGFATSATTGVCGVLDLVLDLPYYLDPDFFEASPGTRLTTRWDGTTVPVESVARNWWRNESTSYRSAKYVGTDSGGTAVIGSAEDFGIIYVNTSQTRANSNGSNTSQHTSRGYHATPCMAQAYGKTHGWAFNANKWHLSIIWRTGSQSISNYFKILKIFHQLKPNRASDNTKNPTISSNSWGRGHSYFSSNYFYRQSGDGTGGVAFNSWNPPQFMRYWRGGSRHEHQDPVTGYEHNLGAAAIDVGVFICVAAGNNNQKQVLDGHPDYNNYYGPGNHTLESAKANSFMVNRIGFPASIGLVEDYNNSGMDKYRGFNIGCLDDNKQTNTSEQKATYSNMGNAIDCYTHGDQSLAAGDDNWGWGRYDRNDTRYTLNGTQSDNCQDVFMGGTSSACPVATGLIATKLQHKRTWVWSDVKDWLQNQVENQTSAAFPEGDEPVGANNQAFNTNRSLMGGDRKILWDAPIDDDGVTISGPLNITGSLNITS